MHMKTKNIYISLKKATTGRNVGSEYIIKAYLIKWMCLVVVISLQQTLNIYIYIYININIIL